MFVVAPLSTPTARRRSKSLLPLAVLSALSLAALPFGATAATETDTGTGTPVAKLTQPISALKSLPVVTAQPQSVVALAGLPATFRVTASSAAAMSYQWTRNGSKIAGASGSTYVIAATSVADSGASFAVTVKTLAGSVTSATARLTVNAVAARAASADRPFNDQSPWNARPSRFTLGNYVVPKSDYYPNVAEGTWSLGVFVGAATDPAVTVYGDSDPNGIWVPDAESMMAPVVIAHWPAGVVPAPGSDGHADIVDPITNRIHSFWQLRLDNGKWRASAYSWTPLDGSGFGTPGQYMQGARAAGVASMAGLIRKSEVDDGLPSYKHALVMSMTFNALSRTTPFIAPATSADWDASTTNSGEIPEGARMMIPTSFDTSVIRTPKLLKIVKTLQTYGAMVVDRNWGTPYLIYVENGSNYNLMPNGWDMQVAAELDIIRGAMRQVTSVDAWVDANGVAFVPDTKLELLSMRGYWTLQQGVAAGVFDTQQQAVVFPANGVLTRQVNWTGRSMPSVATTPLAGKSVTLKVKASGGAQVKLELHSGGNTVLSTGYLADGADVTFIWPADGLMPFVFTQSGPNGGGTVSASLKTAS